MGHGIIVTMCQVIMHSKLELICQNIMSDLCSGYFLQLWHWWFIFVPIAEEAAFSSSQLN